MGSVEESPKKMNVTIIGGSLSGLIHGVALKCKGHNVTILERRPASDTASQGAGLSAGPSAQEFMNTFDKIPSPWAVMTKGQFVINKDAEQMMYWPNPMASTSWDIIYYRLRANFDGMKSRYCQQDLPRVEGEGKVHYMDGITVDNLRYEDGNVFIDYSNAAGTPGVIKSDLVIAADGSSSKVRRMLLPEVERQYLGYCGWRGVVPESELSIEKNNPDSTPTFCAFKDGFIMKYLIPGKDGSIEKGRRLMNYVWYQQAPEGSQQLRDQFTDVEGNTHRYTLPIGKMRPEEVEKMRATAHEMLDPHTAEIVCKTANPFVQSITSVNPKRATFFNGKLLLVGDALATFRPMSSAGINQSSVDALALIRMLDGKISLQEWEKEVLEYAATAQAEGLQRQGLFYFTEARKAQMAAGGAGAAGGYTGKPAGKPVAV